MNLKSASIFLILGFILLGMKPKSDFPKTLKGTNWNSQFSYYSNFYHFDSDSTGYSEDGQVAWSFPIDSSTLGDAKDSIIYLDRKLFNYHIEDSTLTIDYPSWKINDTLVKRVFHFNPKKQAWCSDYEYTYGREWLKEGEKKAVLKF